MIFHTLILLVQVVFVFNDNIFELSQEETTLIEFNKFYRGDTDLNDLLVQPLPIVLLFADNLKIIFEKLYAYYGSVFPTKEELANTEGKGNFKIRIKFVEDVCKEIVRSIDLMYMNRVLKPSAIGFYKLHSRLCISIKKLIAECSQTNINEEKVIQIEFEDLNFRRMYKKIGQFPRTTDYENYRNKTNYQVAVVEYISKVNVFQDDINWTSKFIDSPCIYNDPIESEKATKIQFTKSEKLTDSYVKSLTENKKFIQLMDNFEKENSWYINQIDTAGCIKLPDNMLLELSNNSIELTNYLIKYTFIRLEQSLIYVFSSSTFSVSDLDNMENINKNVLFVIERLCRCAPDILLYLFKHDIFGSFDYNLFGMYVSFCPNYTDYIDTRCSPEYSDHQDSLPLYQKKCVTNSIKNKFIWNFYTRNKKKYLQNEYDTEKVIKDCMELHFTYIEKIYNYIHEFYKQNENEILVWSTSNWFTEKYLLSEKNDNPGIEHLKYNNVAIQKTKFTLTNMYYYLSPLHSNINAILLFKTLTLQKLYIKFHNYLYQQAAMTIFYLTDSITEHQEIKDSTRSQINNSVKWYTLCLDKLSNTLSSLDVECTTHKKVSSIISLIKNLQGKNDATVIRTEIGDDIFEPIIKHIKSLNDYTYYLINNCMEAMDFVYQFVSIVYKSIQIINPINNGLEEFKNNYSQCDSLGHFFQDEDKKTIIN